MKSNLFKIVCYIALPIVLWVLVVSNFGVSINLSNSTPYQIFIVHKHVLPKGVGEYIVFDAPNNGRYDKPFVKKVGGVAGDEVTRKERGYYVNGSYIGDAKTHSQDGQKANLGPVGVIPEGKYFVYLESKDSYDSRYREVGWVDSSNIRGVAYPIY